MINHESAHDHAARPTSPGGGRCGACLRATREPANSPARIRESFDFGWKFFKGDAPGAQSQLHGLRVAHPRSAARLEHRRPLRRDRRRRRGACPRASAGIGSVSAHPSPANVVDRVRRRLSEQRCVDQRPVSWQTALWLHRFRIRSHAAPEAGDNVIAVNVDNSKQPNCRWYSGSGIYRHMWLMATNPCTSPLGDLVTTPRVSKKRARSTVKTR